MRKITIKYKEWSFNSNNVGLLGKSRHLFPQLYLVIKGDVGRLTDSSVETSAASFCFSTVSLILLSLWIFLLKFLYTALQLPGLPLFFMPLITRCVTFGYSLNFSGHLFSPF